MNNFQKCRDLVKVESTVANFYRWLPRLSEINLFDYSNRFLLKPELSQNVIVCASAPHNLAFISK